MKNTKEFILENKEITNTDRRKSLKSLPSHNENPFARDTIVHADKGYKMKTFGTKKLLADIETGEIEEGLLVARKIEVDKGEFVKIYVDQMKTIYDLPRAARKLFEYIAHNLEINADEIYIYHPDAMAFCGYNQVNQIINALCTLTELGIISKSYRAGWWFINPTILFNGNRLVLVSEYMRKDKAKEKQWDSDMKKKLNADNDE